MSTRSATISFPSKNPRLHHPCQLHRSYRGRRHQPPKTVSATHQRDMPEQGTATGIPASAVAAEPAAVTVRPLREEDKERWLELFKAYITWYKATVRYQLSMTSDLLRTCQVTTEAGTRTIGLTQYAFLETLSYCHLNLTRQ